MPVSAKSRLKPHSSAAGHTLGLAPATTSQLVQRLGKGLPYVALLRFHKATELPIGAIADLLRIPPRTLVRRRAARRLHPDESERLFRIASLFEKALDLFEGDADAARRWLTTPSEQLDRHAPLDFARTEVGAREVEDLIGALEHGIFA
jgi:putative toxin-antitoxin system antitoxin component (TIGR02293 family)